MAALTEEEIDILLIENPLDVTANRMKAKACYVRGDNENAFLHAKMGIPVGEDGMEAVGLNFFGGPDLAFARILRAMYLSQGELDKAIECFELYSRDFPVDKTQLQKDFLATLQELKLHKLELEANQKAKELVEEEEEEKKLKNEIEKKVAKNNKKKKKSKNKGGTKAEISSLEAKEVESSRALEMNEEESNIPEPKILSETSEANVNEEDWIDTIVFNIVAKKIDHVYVGSMGSDINGYEDHCFIEASDPQIACYEQLKKLGTGSAGILYVQRMIHGPNNKMYFVVERVRPIDSVFKERICSPAMDKATWWKNISVLFKQIFGDVIEALQFLYSKHSACGDLFNAIYITQDGAVKLLPSMDGRQTAVTDLKQLIAKMKAVIGMPFNPCDVDDPEFDLPLSLRHFLSSYGNTNPKIVPWILKAPYFWTIDQELKFLEGMARIIRSNTYVRKQLQSDMDRNSVYTKGVWKRALDGAYYAVWSKGDPSLVTQSVVPRGMVKINPYVASCDLYRYLCAAVKHINEQEYNDFRPLKALFSQEKIASDINDYYPTVYVDSHWLIYQLLRAKPHLVDEFVRMV